MVATRREINTNKAIVAARAGLYRLWTGLTWVAFLYLPSAMSIYDRLGRHEWHRACISLVIKKDDCRRVMNTRRHLLDSDQRLDLGRPALSAESARLSVIKGPDFLRDVE